MTSSMPQPFDLSTTAREFEQRHLAPFWQRRMLELHVLCRLLDEECAVRSSNESMLKAYRRLRLAGRASEKVLRNPALLGWINLSRYVVTRGMHRSIPQGHVRDHIDDLSRFAFAAAHGSGIPAEAAIRVQGDGQIFLPGLGLVLTVGKEHAGEIVSVVTDGNSLTAILGSKCFNASTERGILDVISQPLTHGWKILPRLAWGLLLDNSPELVRYHSKNNPKWKVCHPDKLFLGQWLERSIQACELISLVEHSLFVPVRSVLSSIVPLDAPADVNLSATTTEVLGCICTSLPASAGLLAETLVHEAAHTALHIASDALLYWNTKESRVYRSPWRKELRPISGMMHGIVAFVGVGEFWARLLADRAATEFGSLARSRLYSVVRQVRNAIEGIFGSPELTENGRLLLNSAKAKLTELEGFSETYEPPADERRWIAERQKHHDDALPQLTAPQHRTSSVDSIWSAQIGTAMPPPINHLSNKVTRRELVSDRIHLSALKRDSVVGQWEDILKTTEESEPESTALVRGSLCYGRGDFFSAISWYARYVERRWEDVDAWRLLGAALRRAGRHDDALVIAFSLDQLQQLNPLDVRVSFGEDWPARLGEVILTRVKTQTQPS